MNYDTCWMPREPRLDPPASYIVFDLRMIRGPRPDAEVFSAVANSVEREYRTTTACLYERKDEGETANMAALL